MSGSTDDAPRGRPGDGAAAGDPAPTAAAPPTGEGADHQANGGGHGDGRDGQPTHGGPLPGLALAALGVVFGDIGTSPIYALRESFHESHGLVATAPNVLGVLSLIFWSLIIVISVKYLAFVMRAHNRGEGGIIALTALVAPPGSGPVRGRRYLLVMAGLFGAALLYGDSMITPAISVLSAIEGLEVATPLFRPVVIPVTLLILVALFFFQKRGTAGVGAVFGPVMLLWFTTLAVLGVVHVASYPAVLEGLNPLHAVHFFLRNQFRGLLVLGSVFLVVTGGEALYADMGHFGTRPIRIAWFALVLPALLLNYFGQGALILRQPAALSQPFFYMAPDWALLPLVLLTTAATIIASQAVISGAFSLTRQAVQLGYLPRLEIEHTSTQLIGQIYIPVLNWVLMLACLGLVLGFRTSGRLAAAYGVAVTTDMVFTTILFAVLALRTWRWPLAAVIAMAALFLGIDLSFWGANLLKIPHGGWFPLLVAGSIFVLMTTWKRGRAILAQRLASTTLPIDLFMEDVRRNPPVRVPGTAVFMYGSTAGTPPALLHNLKHNMVLHEQVILLTVLTLQVPYAPEAERVSMEDLGEGVCRVFIRYGFAEDVDVPAALGRACHNWLGGMTMARTTFFLGRETLIPTKRPGMAIWREHLFSLMSRNAARATAFFSIPPNRVIEVGAQIEL